MESDDSILAALRQAFVAPKYLPKPPIWQETPHKGTLALRLKGALAIEGVIQEGLYLYGRTLKRPFGEDVTFGLQYTYGEINHQLVRLDWRPKRPHTDQIGPISARQSFSGSNLHSFDDNAKYGVIAFRNNLPKAVPLEPDPLSFHDLMINVGQRLNILNIDLVPEPPWDTQESLL
jgi:hypothetical protein